MRTRAIAVVGSGTIGETHVAAIRSIPHARLAGVSSRTEEKARRLGERGGCRWTTDWRELVRDPGVEVVDVATSSGSHAEVAMAALQAGKHVLVEKPMAMRTAEATAMIDRARAAGLTLGVVSQRRFEEQHAAVKRVLAEGALGRLLLAEVSCPYYRTQAYYDSADWRGRIETDGGALMNQAIHSVDLLLWLAGPAREVVGRTATQIHRMEAEDLALGIVKLAGGGFATIMASTNIQPGFAPALGLYGEKGTIKLEGANLAHWTVPGVPMPEFGPAQASAGVADPKLSSHRHHQRQIEDVLAAIEEKRPPAVTGEDGRRAVELIQGLYESARTGRAVELRG
jgi:predicted dehydrogenase